ncbi:hypothetical protein A3I99_02225 [Candidatus Kaiserbacteria bacterium RIFCSPLOWO2_02_FULL_45_11b]|uniref:Uncharacterized protein n=1 Tax=Candidatus Kaiserbacteria bacterium RIFCSPLOWO2_12_FULL_45_26 TaxID=1798525 RepID=A0A1F6FF49_9BACT|nr:MAG: hypothetical protein A2929_03970 [Candidatus Kaiserbacteria bacterium RIFCSPLOWO2_01_FULL_45_25]OGG81878.1 MAG: hypothetical protein A3I99_02225 [Candidatus Kaiserbacteria bacterium RIFCSPLOWO2_02_FULL_45_11b]OGG84472.1 MAG: hypothetical protein A3G90_00015 [Candidatus Kaiserbacteria bacterium RIFCSPLOWO2_12_FULL_45_26]
MKSGIDKLALRAFSVTTESVSDFIIVKLLTHKEKIAIGRRLIIAEAIKAGKTRMEINNKISISPNTFTQIKHWIDSDQKIYSSARTPEGVNRKHIHRHSHINPLTYADMKRRYPAHYLLFSIVEELWKRK